MSLTIERLVGFEERLKQQLNREEADWQQRLVVLESNLLVEENAALPLKYGPRIGIAHGIAHEIEATVCTPSLWPMEYRKALIGEIGRHLALVAGPYGVTEKDILEVKPADGKSLIRKRELQRLEPEHQEHTREVLGDELAGHVFARIQRESIEAILGMPRREVHFAEFDADLSHIKCPKVTNAVLYGLELDGPERVSPQMRAMAQLLLQLNNAHMGCGAHPHLQEITTAMREFYTVHEQDCLPYAVRSMENAGHLIFWDEPHLPAVRPESWAVARERIRQVAGNERLHDAELEILEVGLNRLEKPDLCAGVAEKLRMALGEHLTPDVRAALDDPTPERILAARKSLRLPDNEEDPEMEDRYRRWRAEQNRPIRSIMDDEWQTSFDSSKDSSRGHSH